MSYGKSAAPNPILIALHTSLISVHILPSLCSSSVTLMLLLQPLLTNLQFCDLCLSSGSPEAWGFIRT